MNDLKREQMKKELREEMRAQGYGWIDGKYRKPPEELGFGRRASELSCVDMINSILAYDWYGFSAEEVMQIQEKSRYSYLADYVDVLGRDRVVELIQGQINDIDHILRNVYRDSEGLSYNSIVWKEEVAV